MVTKQKSELMDTFIHPTEGESRRDPRYLAIRWRPGATADAKNDLLGRTGLEVAEIDRPDVPALPGVNQTDGLSWVRARNGEPIAPETAADLEASEIVAWVAPAFRAVRGEESAPSIFTINPQRF